MQTNSEFLTKVPVYIVGLDVQDLESSMAESKFRRSIESLSHVYPDIAEARAMVKSFSSEKQRRHYEAHVLIRMSRHQFEFNEEAWSVEEVFENVGVKIKRLMTKPRDSPARRRSLSRGEAEQARY